MSKFSAAESADHPYVETGDLKTETCLKCHPNKNQGKFVHTAVGMGCENCHRAASADNQTTITLWATGGDLCAKCHELSRTPVLHGPYKTGQCLICHNPHAGAYPAQARAAVSTLCLGCHMLNQPDVRVNAQAKTVSLLDGRVYDLASWQSAPKIGGGHPEGNIPRKAGDAAIGRATGKPDAKLNCLSCHDPHASKSQHLLRQAASGLGATDDLSLGNPSNFICAQARPQNVPALADPISGGQI